MARQSRSLPSDTELIAEEVKRLGDRVAELGQMAERMVEVETFLHEIRLMQVRIAGAEALIAEHLSGDLVTDLAQRAALAS